MAVPLIIAGLLILSHVFEHIHSFKWISGGATRNELLTECRTTMRLGKYYDYCRTDFYNGQLMSERMYDGDMMHGEARDYYPNGNVMWEGAFLNDELHGPAREYDFDGSLQSEYGYERDELEGEYREYYPSGRLKHTGQYRKGKIDGLWKTYYENGVLAEELNGHRGRLLAQNGKSLEGTYVLRYADGSVWREAEYTGRGACTDFTRVITRTANRRPFRTIIMINCTARKGITTRTVSSSGSRSTARTSLFPNGPMISKAKWYGIIRKNKGKVR